MTRADTEEEFLRSLLQIRARERSDAECTADFRRTLLRDGSETDDNLNCVARLEVGTVSRDWRPKKIRALKLQALDITVSDVISTAEGDPVPTSVLERYPGIAQEDWNACLRIVTLVLVALERPEWEV